MAAFPARTIRSPHERPDPYLRERRGLALQRLIEDDDDEDDDGYPACDDMTKIWQNMTMTKCKIELNQPMQVFSLTKIYIADDDNDDSHYDGDDDDV